MMKDYSTMKATAFGMLLLAMTGAMFVACSDDEFYAPSKNLTRAARNGNPLVEHIVTSGTQESTLIDWDNKVSFVAIAKWTTGWAFYDPQAKISLDASDVSFRLLDSTVQINPTNYIYSHELPYFKVSPMCEWINGIQEYKITLGYKIVYVESLPDTKDTIHVTKEGICEKNEKIPAECLSTYYQY